MTSNSAAAPSFPPLPIESILPRIVEAVLHRGILTLSAEPGAGKTSLVPLALGRALKGGVLVMEPRRVAAVAAAARLASLGGFRLGEEVGYRVRGESLVSKQSRIQIVTPGILLRMIQSQPELPGWDCVILDEFHERSAQADLALALLRECRQLRPDLALLLMSATMDSQAIAAQLGAEQLSAPGKSYPIETRHAPLSRSGRLEAGIASLVCEALAASEADVLVFLPGQAELNRAKSEFEALGTSRTLGAEALLLHGSLPLDQQRRILDPPADSRRRVIFSTSIAESSLTVPRVRAVVDSGLARFQRFLPRTGLQRLVTETESRDRADQRRGRAGRLGPGLCIRAWPASEVLPEQSGPEIGRSELSSLVLEASLWGAGGRMDLPWLDPPPEQAWEAGLKLLSQLGALDREARVTDFGRAMASLGTEARLAALVLRGAEAGIASTACLAAALLSEGSASELSDGDILGSLEALEKRPSMGRTSAEGRIREEARRLQRALGERAGRAEETASKALPAVLAKAFPDRLGQRITFEAGKARFKLASGRILSASGPLALSPWVLALDAEAGAAEGKIYSGAPISEEAAVEALGPQTEDRLEAEWKGLDLRARKVRGANAIVLASQPAPRPVARDIALLIKKRWREEGLEFLPWSEGGAGARAGDLLARLRFYLALKPETALRFDLKPESFSDKALGETADSWLTPYLRDSGPVLDAEGLCKALASLLPWDFRNLLDRELPLKLALPSGSERLIDYLSAGAPSVEARVQEFFGLRLHPQVCGVAIRLSLLDPGGKPLQVTSDLPGFWAGSWQEARKELRGRYPKHEWPQDPGQARASRSGIKRRQDSDMKHS